jgi:hypothetical protein
LIKTTKSKIYCGDKNPEFNGLRREIKIQNSLAVPTNIDLIIPSQESLWRMHNWWKVKRPFAMRQRGFQISSQGFGWRGLTLHAAVWLSLLGLSI